MSDNFKFVQCAPFSLAGAGAVIGNTTLTLKSFAGIDGGLLTMTDFGTIGFGTLEPGNGTLEEQISFSGVTQNVNGTATLTGVKSVLFVSPYTQTTGLLKTHAGSTTFIISNTAGFYDELIARNDDETITGTWTFTNPNYPRMDTATPLPTDDEQLATKKYVDEVAVFGAPKATNTVYGITKLSVAAASPTVPISVGDNDNRVSPVSLATLNAGEVQALVGTSGTPSTSNKYVTNDDTSVTSSAGKLVRANSLGKIDNSFLQFGGTGADGALTITSGTTTIDLGSASEVIKNYTSISITGTGALAFSNPNVNGTKVVLRSQAGVTLTSSATPMINAAALGAAGGAAVTATVSGTANGNTGSNTLRLKYVRLTAGIGCLSSGAAGTGAGGTKDFSFDFLTSGTYPTEISNFYEFLIPGSGGGSGAALANGFATSTSGAGGRGGGALLIECGGAFNFTTASGISVAGVVGGNGTGSAGTNVGGGGGGGGGSFVCLYNTLTANTGTVTITGGAGGSNFNANNYKGGGGASITGAGVAGGPAGLGTGADGLSIIRQNIIRT